MVQLHRWLPTKNSFQINNLKCLCCIVALDLLHEAQRTDLPWAAGRRKDALRSIWE